MSDDEEVLHEGGCLHKHLTEQGYSDIETYISNSFKKNDLHIVSSTSGNRGGSEYSGNNFILNLEDKNNLLTIQNSQLLFKEDTCVVDSLLTNVQVCSNKEAKLPSWAGAILGLGITSIISSFIGFQKMNQMYSPLGFFSCFALCGSCFMFKNFQKPKINKDLKAHTNDLQNICLYIHKILRYLKETEVLSSSQIPIHSSFSYLFSSTSKHDESELDSLPNWKTLPYLRKFVLDTLVEIITTLIHCSDSLKSSLGMTVPLKKPLEAFDSIISSDGCVPLKNLQMLIDLYLVLQSEYLKDLCVIISPLHWNSSTESYTKRKVSKVLQEHQVILRDINFKLRMQYNIHNLLVTSKKQFYGHKTLQNQQLSQLKSKDNINLQLNVHNIFLMLYSALLRVRNVEDSLENKLTSTCSQNPIDINQDIFNELKVLRDDLSSALKYYDSIFHQTVSDAETSFDKQSIAECTNRHDDKIFQTRETGIVVGASDFNVNSPDEVFLAISGLNVDNRDNNIDDICFDKKPQFPKSLLTELSKTLASKKKEFSEREKKALERQGLEDFRPYETSSADSDGDENNLPLKTKKRKHAKMKPLALSSDSDSENSCSDWDSHKKKHLSLKSHRPPNFEIEPTTSLEGGEDNSRIKNVTSDSRFIIQGQSLANLIAAKSQMWGKTSEEYFSDS